MYNFGIPPQRTPRVEKYPETPVITFQKHPKEKGKNFKFSFNKYAVEMLNMNLGEDQFAFAFVEGEDDTDNKVLIARVGNEVPEKQRANVGKNATVSHKRYSRYVYTFLDLDPELDYEFELVVENVNDETGQVIYRLEEISTENNQQDETKESYNESIIGMGFNSPA